MSTTDFSFIRDANTRRYMENAYIVISALDGGWEFMRTFEPEQGKGFMFSEHPMLTQIYSRIDTAHSGASLALVMRGMELFAKQGLAEFRKVYE